MQLPKKSNYKEPAKDQEYYEEGTKVVRSKRRKISVHNKRLDKLESDILYLAKQLGVELK